MELLKEDLNRSFGDIQVREMDDSREVEIAFSSELPYLRAYGYEVLSHKEGHVDMSRLKNNAPLLADHDMNDQIGVVTSARIDSDGVGRATIKFSRSQRGTDYLNDIKDGIRQKISVGYSIGEIDKTGTRGDHDEYTATSWAPYEISVVSVPADDSVGVGRNFEKEITMAEEAIVDTTEEVRSEEVVVEKTPVIDELAIRAAAVEEYKLSVETERKADEAKAEEKRLSEEVEAVRVSDIETICEAHDKPEIARTHIQMGNTPEEAARAVLETLTTKGSTMDNVKTEAIELGLTDKEVQEFSITRAAIAMANPTDKRAAKAAGFEMEVSDAYGDLKGKVARGMWIPEEITRANSVGTATTGGNLVEKELMADSFIDLLRNSSSLLGMTTHLSGLVGDVTIPRQTSTATVGWVAEDAAQAESSATFDLVSLSPKTLAGRTYMTRKAMIQTTPSIEMLVRKDLATSLGLAWDLGILNGSGSSNQPTGVLNAADVNAVANGTRTNGKALTWDDLVEMWSQVATDNAAFGDLSYVFNAATISKAMRTQQFASSNGMSILSALPYGHKMSNQLVSNGTKGTGTALSTAIFGNFKDVITATWSGLDMVVDPYSNNNGGLEIRVFQDADVAVRHGQSFCAAKDIITV